MQLLTKSIDAKLVANATQSASDPDTNWSEVHKPPLKLFNPVGAATWLISERVDDDTLFGLCDLGLGEPELGYVSLAELTSVRLAFGLGIERDIHFTPTKTLWEYYQEARTNGRIVA